MKKIENRKKKIKCYKKENVEENGKRKLLGKSGIIKNGSFLRQKRNDELNKRRNDKTRKEINEETENDDVTSEGTSEEKENDSTASEGTSEKSENNSTTSVERSEDTDAEETEAKEEMPKEKNGIDKVADMDPYLLKDAYYIKRSELWKNRQRVLLVRCPIKRKNCKVFIDNLKLLIPHNKVEGKWERKLCKAELNEISATRNCNNIVFLDVHRKRYCLWICKPQTGPSLYCEILDFISLHSLLFSGNCLLFSRPLLLFSKSFDKLNHLKLIKEMFIHVFGIPNYHPLSKPFYDHCYHFFYANELIYFRHYQILPVTLADANNIHKQKLVEIGPRFTLHIIKIFSQCFSGDVIYENKRYEYYASPKLMKNVEKQKKIFKSVDKRIKRTRKLMHRHNFIKSDIDL